MLSLFTLYRVRNSDKLYLLWRADYLPSDSGGEEVLLDVGGQDATEAFEDVGHSDEARETLEQLKVGVLKRKVCLFSCWGAVPRSHVRLELRHDSTQSDISAVLITC